MYWLWQEEAKLLTDWVTTDWPVNKVIHVCECCLIVPKGRYGITMHASQAESLTKWPMLVRITIYLINTNMYICTCTYICIYWYTIGYLWTCGRLHQHGPLDSVPLYTQVVEFTRVNLSGVVWSNRSWVCCPPYDNEQGPTPVTGQPASLSFPLSPEEKLVAIQLVFLLDSQCGWVDIGKHIAGEGSHCYSKRVLYIPFTTCHVHLKEAKCFHIKKDWFTQRKRMWRFPCETYSTSINLEYLLLV